MRSGCRRPEELRDVRIRRNVMKFAEGSCLIEFGNTRVVSTASVEEKVPQFLRGSGSGWITAEYGMLPRSCQSRIPREASRGKQSGRTYEIQRLIGRSLRAVTDLGRLGERTIWIDCDVLQGDGGTRTASITASFIALADAMARMKKRGMISALALRDYVAAISVGIVGGMKYLDLDYKEDSQAEVDMNVVMTGRGKIVEIQGTAEKDPFSKRDMDTLVTLAAKGIKRLIKMQKDILKVRL